MGPPQKEESSAQSKAASHARRLRRIADPRRFVDGSISFVSLVSINGVSIGWISFPRLPVNVGSHSPPGKRPKLKMRRCGRARRSIAEGRRRDRRWGQIRRAPRADPLRGQAALHISAVDIITSEVFTGIRRPRKINSPPRYPRPQSSRSERLAEKRPWWLSSPARSAGPEFRCSVRPT